MRVFVSDNIDGGGIAFNVVSLNKRFNDNLLDSKAVFLSETVISDVGDILRVKKDISFYSTSGKSLFFCLFLIFLRWVFLRGSKIHPIIYHPRFADPRINGFRRLLNRSLKCLPSENVIYYCDEASEATSFNNAYSKRNIIGLMSNIGNVSSENVDGLTDLCEKYEIHISSVGRLVDFKMGYIRSLISFAELNPNVLVSIAGFGPHEKELLDCSKRIENLNFLGKLTLGQSKYLISHSDYYIGMGTTLVDAIELGVNAIVAIESSETGITSGFYSENGSVCYGEFNNEKQYLDLKCFLSKVLFEKVTNSEFSYRNKTSPFHKILEIEKESRKLKLYELVMCMYYLLGSFLYRKLFVFNDYH